MSCEVMQDYIFNQRAIHIQVGRGPQVSFFFGDVTDAVFVDMDQLFWSFY